ncbi:MAG TPA: ABC transporter permease [Bacillales bacterium]|nr:ABC transporter permease [Bacillales bacterium]
MFRYTLQRIGYMIVTIFVIIAITFFTMKLLPGTPYQNEQRLSPEMIQQLNEQYGLDKPVPVQFVYYLAGLVQGDMGDSFSLGGRPVTHIIAHRLPVSAELGIEAMFFGVIAGIILGIIASLRRGTFIDYGTVILAVVGISIPSFVFAVLLQHYFAVKFSLLPVAFWETPSSRVLPIISLGIGVMAFISRFMRTEMVEVLGQDYITFAKAQGMSRITVIVKHGIRNALIPVITIIGPMTAGILTGSLVIENIFAIPGIGDLFIKSILTNDYPVILGTTVLYSAGFVVMLFITDVLYGVIDPRIRIAGGDS